MDTLNGSDSYFPDSAFPVDRWCQRNVSANPTTVARLASRVCAGQVGMLIDPLAGFGASAVAARLLGCDFFGIEIDQFAAAVTLAKGAANDSVIREAAAAVRELDHRDSVNPESLPKMVWATAAVASEFASSAGLSLDEAISLMQRDVAELPAKNTTVVCGDARVFSSWEALIWNAPGVAFISPPFTDDSNAAATSDAQQLAIRAFPYPGVASQNRGLLAGVFEQLAENAPGVHVILEHESHAAHDPVRIREELAMTSATLTISEVVATRNFSGRGTHCYVIGRAGRPTRA
ncbi:MAG: hypothetical protein WA988_06970 [Candidatus Nanopelagicales bacterium]